MYITFENNREISSTVKDSTSFEKVRSAYTPDHIVYAGPEMLFIKDLSNIGQDIIDEYRKLTGIPSIINTSFNIHEEPIVCTPADAIRAFEIGHLDYLAIGNFLIKNPTLSSDKTKRDESRQKSSS